MYRAPTTGEGRKRAARRLVCVYAAAGHRYWPLVSPEDVSDSPALCLCIQCGDLVALQAAFPSVPRPRKRVGRQ